MMTINDLKKKFNNKNLLDTALTHKSWVNEHPNMRDSNERLEFLGDAILEYIVSLEIFRRFPDKEEGYLTALRASLVNTANLAVIANEMSLGSQLHFSKGEDDGGGRINPSLLADCVEAIIGAIYMDMGEKETLLFVETNILSSISQKIKDPLKDPKSLLQEHVQAMKLSAPKYKVVKEVGPDHAKTFLVEALIQNKAEGKGSGKSKLEAEQVAAKEALEKIMRTI